MVVELRDIRVRYPGATEEALSGVSLTLSGGSLTAIMGANGSGKSTLVRVMASLLRSPAGQVAVRGRVGVVFQNPFHQVTSLTVERELAFGLQNLGGRTEDIHRAVESALREFSLSELRDRAPSSLSGGEMQRVALASVLITRPEVLILDEATSLLSPASRRDLLDRVHDAQQQQPPLTVVMVTQFPPEALQCPRIIILKNGRVAIDGVPAEVFSTAERVFALGLPVPANLLLGRAV